MDKKVTKGDERRDGGRKGNNGGKDTNKLWCTGSGKKNNKMQREGEREGGRETALRMTFHKKFFLSLSLSVNYMISTNRRVKTVRDA